MEKYKTRMGNLWVWKNQFNEEGGISHGRAMDAS